MFYITQLIYILEGQEEVFDQFEALAIPIIANYNGRLLLRIRPTDKEFVEGTLERPYEMHLVEFDSEEDFRAFAQDETRTQFLHLKEQSIRSMLLIKGSAL